MPRIPRPMPKAMATMMIICLSTLFREVTYRMTPTTSPSIIRGLEAAMMCSPVLGSAPIHTLVRFMLMASAMSGVPGERKAVRSELEKRIWPSASRYSTSSLSLLGSPATTARALS